MLVVVGFYKGDLDQAERLSARLRELGPYPGHSLLVARDKGTQARPFDGLEFDRIEEIEIIDSPEREWPYPANNVFQKCVKHISWTTQEPFLWIEPDVWILGGPGWLTTMVSEWQQAVAAGKSFLGDFVSVHTAELDVPDHMSGVGFYPAGLIDMDRQGDIMLCDSIAWDVSGSHIIVPKMQRSELIHHSWKHKAFVDQEQVQREIYDFKPKCVLFHADKTGSLEALRKGMEAAKPVSTVPTTTASTAPPEASPVVSLSGDFAGSNPAPCDPVAPIFFHVGDTDILIKSYPQDYPLLDYCVKSLGKFASGFRRLIIIHPEGDPPNGAVLNKPDSMEMQLIPVREQGDGYQWQMAIKANAHEYTDAKYITHLDSDCFITRPITPATFFQNGKSFWLYTPYNKIEAPWQASTEKFMKEPVEHEYMRRHPTFAPRSLHVALAAFCLMNHGITLKDYIMAQPLRDVSEFNLLGALAYSRYREDYQWINTHE